MSDNAIGPGRRPRGAPSSAASSGSGSASRWSPRAARTPTATAAAAAPTAARRRTTSSGSIGKTSEVPVGGGKIFTADKVVVTQPTAGEFKAFSAMCTHQGCPVSKIEGNEIDCTCHGSKFSIADGSVHEGPNGSEPISRSRRSGHRQGEDLTVS